MDASKIIYIAMSPKKITAICVTYGRVKLLEEAVQCFLDQTYLGERELIVFNTCPEQTLVGEFPCVRIINCETRPKCLSTARNQAIENAGDGILVTWDDDDKYCSHYLQVIADNFADDWMWLSDQFYAVNGVIKSIVNGSMNVVSYTKNAWLKVGGFTSGYTVGEDRDFVGKLTTQTKGKKADINPFQIGFIYGWGEGNYHISGMGDDNSKNQPAYLRAEQELKRRLNRKAEPRGVVNLQPKRKQDWDMATKTFLLQKGYRREKTIGVGVICLGRFGDLINCLPILKKLHDDGKNPHLIIAREFASILEGISYVTPCIQDVPWVNLDHAKRLAANQFTETLVLQVYGKGHKQEQRTASYNMEPWHAAGMLEDFHNELMKPVFDRRDAKREALILAKLFTTTKPKIVTNLTRSLSSPFRNGTNLLSSIRQAFKATHEVIEIGNLKLQRIYDLLAIIEKAALFISVDTATLHLAAATNVPVIALVNDEPWLGSVVRYNEIRTLPYKAATKEAVLETIRGCFTPKRVYESIPLNTAKTVSAVIAVYKPDITRLNRCLAAVLPQVDEVIVCSDLDTDWPASDSAYFPNEGKIKCVRLLESKTGYGKKANYGAKFAKGDAILFLNDDVYLNPDTVAGLLRELQGNTAIVSHTLRYPNGMIQYGGKYRAIGARNFADADERRLMSRHRFVVEQESACGASMLIRREVFEQAGGFDPAYFLYCEDDDLAMKVRQAGYRIMFTPLVEGIHEGNASMAITPGWRDILKQSCRTFAQRWGFYFQLNRNPNVLGKFPAAPAPKPVMPLPIITPVTDDPDYTRIMAKTKKLNPTVTLVYIHVPGDRKHQLQAKEFGDSYMTSPPLYDHETVIVMQGEDKGNTARLCFGPIFFKGFRIYTHDDSGWDIGGYIAVAKTIKTDIMVCCGGSTFFRKAGWMQRMVEAWETHGPGFYGSNAVFDNTPHINTNGFWCSPEMLALYPEKVVTKMNRYNFEHGQRSMWRILNAKGFPCKLVTWDGEFDWQEWRSQPNIFRRGDQSNCLTYWHHHLNYEQAGPELKRRLERGSDTITDPKLLKQKPVVTLIYVYPSGEFRTDEHDSYAKRFVQTYIKFPPNYAHETIVVCNGGPPNDFIHDLFRDIPCSFFEHDDSGWDIGAYLAVARVIHTEAVFCCGGLTSFKRYGWLKRMVDAWAVHGRGMFGSLGSFQYGVKHFATTGFLCPTTLLRQYPKQVITYEERAEFEHGANCITTFALQLGMKALLVTWDGVYSLDEMRRPANVLNKGNQSNCLTYYKQTDIYDATNQQQKRLLQARVDGKI